MVSHKVDASREETAVHVKNVCSCTLCGASADRHGAMVVCTANPNHIADSFMFMFSDHMHPSERKAK